MRFNLLTVALSIDLALGGHAAASGTNHWAFRPPARAPQPSVKLKSWGRNGIDAFILARLETDGLQPSPEADRTTLIRRLSLDLTGLPPTLSEIDSFLANASDDAYDKLVEHLLQSKHYGEFWGRHWLDVARYADSNGFEKDAARSIWPYRDYVINAFNQDMPFDQFTIEQLAGDLLPNATVQQRVATGFLRNSMLNQEGGIEPEQFRMDSMFDRIDAVGKAWLGLTVACAQCHDHKYDPISQREYYQFFAFLNNDDEPFIEVPTAKQEQKRAELLTQVRAAENKTMQSATNLAERMADWEQQIPRASGEWTPLEPKEWMNFATKYEKQSDYSLLGGGDVKSSAVTHIWVDTRLTSITGFRLEALMHPNLPYGGPGLVAKGSFLLKEFVVEASPLTNITATNRVVFNRALADQEAPGFAITNAIDGNTEKGGWTAATVPVRRNSEHRAVFECAEPIGFAGGTRLKFTLYQKHSVGDGHSGALDKDTGLDCHAFGRFRLSATTQTTPLQVDPLSAKQREILKVASEKRDEGQRRELFDVYRHQDAAFAQASQEIDNIFTNWPYAPTTLALQRRAEARTTRLFKRGDWQRPAETVEPGVPAVLHALSVGQASSLSPTDASNPAAGKMPVPPSRLDLAKWIVDRGSPTTARVIVNRVWQTYFGQGLFATPEDIGTRCETPIHRDLLDWLACEFMDSGWSFKSLHRSITHSATYRQSSRIEAELYDKDPYNRLLARGPRFRVEGETVQDIALWASGLLNPKIGGPSVRPPIPESVGDTVYAGFSWPVSVGEERYRRGMYTFWKRALPFPSLIAFDTPAGESSCPRRARSNTPIQALTTLNEKTFVESAQALGLRVYKEGGSEERSRAIYAFRLCTGRAPAETELKSMLSFWEEQYRYFEDRTSSALSVALADAKQIPADVNLHKIAAWAMVGRALLNLDETITKE